MSSSNKTKLKALKRLYRNECMFTGVRSELTYHHIEKKCYGGNKSVDNGAILSSLSQDWLHNFIEQEDLELFDLCNECLLLFKMALDNKDEELIKMYKEEIMPLYREYIYNNSIENHRQFDVRVKILKKEINKNE